MTEGVIDLVVNDDPHAITCDERGYSAACQSPVWLDPYKGFVCAHRVTQWWHRFKGELIDPEHPEEGPSTITITLGPTRHGPDSLGDDEQGIPIKQRTFPLAGFTKDGSPGPEAQYVGSFTEEPEDDEEWT